MFYFGLAKIRRFIIFHSVFDKGINRENIGEYPKAMSYLYLALSLMPRSVKTYVAIARVNRKHKTYPYRTSKKSNKCNFKWKR